MSDRYIKHRINKIKSCGNMPLKLHTYSILHLQRIAKRNINEKKSLRSAL
uniref:Uncharacterized protein n=1 Tax=Arundo donax TaxID=35708 RepID=A0A0A9AQ62_ARUDO